MNKHVFYLSLFVSTASLPAMAQEWDGALGQPTDLPSVTAVADVSGLSACTAPYIVSTDAPADESTDSAIIWSWDGDQTWNQIATPWHDDGQGVADITGLAVYDSKLWAVGFFYKEEGQSGGIGWLQPFKTYYASSSDCGRTWQTAWPTIGNEAGIANSVLAVNSGPLQGLYIAGTALENPANPTDTHSFIRISGSGFTGLGLAGDFPRADDSHIQGFTMASGPVCGLGDVVVLGGLHEGVNGERHLSAFDGTDVVVMPGEVYSEVTTQSDDGKSSLLLTSYVKALEFHEGDLYVGGFFPGVYQDNNTYLDESSLVKFDNGDCKWDTATEDGLSTSDEQVATILRSDGDDRLFVGHTWTGGLAIIQDDEWNPIAGSYHGLSVIEAYDTESAGGDMIHAGNFNQVGPNDDRVDALKIALYLGLSCAADLNYDGTVDGSDLTMLLGHWGSSTADIDGNGTTNGGDLTILLGHWGVCS